mmetsp:Transcript_41670/g.69395  ORF Transcript_41670/g.69395 Transcript_41670/m.69395 type:complete len:123 (+) Transcript_41670:3960-4328(+)
MPTWTCPTCRRNCKEADLIEVNKPLAPSSRTSSMPKRKGKKRARRGSDYEDSEDSAADDEYNDADAGVPDEVAPAPINVDKQIKGHAKQRCDQQSDCVHPVQFHLHPCYQRIESSSLQHSHQ